MKKKVGKSLGGAIIVFTAIIAFSASALAVELPKILKDGFDEYLKEGPKAAIESWIKGGSMEGNKDALSQANNFQRVQEFYGNFVGYNLTKVKEHSATSSVYLIEMKYEKGNLFSKFFLYKKPDGKVVINTFNFNTNPESVWPNYLVYGCEDE